MHKQWLCVAAAFVIVLAHSSVRSAAGVVMDWTTVGDPGNAPDPMGYLTAGAVAYTYQIGKYEVTNAQYVEFLNAKAASDPLNLYNPSMSTDARGGINRSGTSGGYSYAVKTGYATMPVVWVSWYDAIRFANWMNNGQGSGDTEIGAYTLLGNSPVPSNSATIARNPGATVALANNDEWHKAAYYQPASAGGDTDNYWRFPTRSNVDPASDQPPGDPTVQSNVANYYRDDGLANGYNDGYAATGSTLFNNNQNYLMNVGAYPASSSYYGTFDQGGNAQEWLESHDNITPPVPDFRLVRGGAWNDSDGPPEMDAFGAKSGPPTHESYSVGFRLVSLPANAPEPGVAGIMLILGSLRVLCRRR